MDGAWRTVDFVERAMGSLGQIESRAWAGTAPQASPEMGWHHPPPMRQMMIHEAHRACRMPQGHMGGRSQGRAAWSKCKKLLQAGCVPSGGSQGEVTGLEVHVNPSELAGPSQPGVGNSLPPRGARTQVTPHPTPATCPATETRSLLGRGLS